MNGMAFSASVSALALAALIGLSACGGGGGTPIVPDPGTGGSQPASLTESQLYGDLDAYSDLAANSPNFGSITQSSNGNGISTDRVETTLEAGGRLIVVVRDGNGDVSLELDSRADLRENLNGTEWMDDGAEDFRPNWSGNGWVLSKQDGNDTVVAVAYTAWEDADNTNYLAGGYWVKVNANDDVTEMGTFGDAGPGSVFSYYDGQNSSWERPLAGTATYRGDAEGAYVGPGGDGGVWWSMLMLNADFSTNSISGCAGCPDADPSGGERGIYTYSTIDDLKNDRWTEEDLYIALNGNQNIRNNGSFEGTLEVLEYATDNKLASQGKWGGLFSENGNSASSPEQVIGTLGGTAETAEGRYGFVGIFHGQE
jgi:hypothetical protein